MTTDHPAAHFEALIAAAANANALTSKVIEDAQRELARHAAARLVKKSGRLRAGSRMTD